MISIKHIGYNGKIDGIREFRCILTFFSKKPLENLETGSQSLQRQKSEFY